MKISQKKKKSSVSNKDSSSNPLLTDLDFRDKKEKRIHKAQLWFEKDAFKNLENEEDEDYELGRMIDLYKKKGGRIIGEERKVESENSHDQKNKIKNKRKRKDSEKSDETDSDYDVEEMMTSDKKVKKIGGKDGFEVVPRETGKESFCLE